MTEHSHEGDGEELMVHQVRPGLDLLFNAYDITDSRMVS